jgi:hypothetical protein
MKLIPARVINWLDVVEARAAKAVGPKPNWNTEEWVAELSQLIGKDIPRLVKRVRELEAAATKVLGSWDDLQQYDCPNEDGAAMMDALDELRALLKGGSDADEG